MSRAGGARFGARPSRRRIAGPSPRSCTRCGTSSDACADAAGAVPRRRADLCGRARRDRAGGFALPVGAPQIVDEVDAEGVFSLAHLPLLPAALALEGLAESADLVGHGLVGGRARQEAADPADAVGRRFSFTNRVFRRNSPNCCNEASSSRIGRPPRSPRGNRRARVPAGGRRPITLAVRALSAPVCGGVRRSWWNRQPQMSSQTSNWPCPHLPGLGVLRPPEPIHGI
jgi:hypothetical protein